MCLHSCILFSCLLHFYWKSFHFIAVFALLRQKDRPSQGKTVCRFFDLSPSTFFEKSLPPCPSPQEKLQNFKSSQASLLLVERIIQVCTTPCGFLRFARCWRCTSTCRSALATSWRSAGGPREAWSRWAAPSDFSSPEGSCDSAKGHP